MSLRTVTESLDYDQLIYRGHNNPAATDPVVRRWAMKNFASGVIVIEGNNQCKFVLEGSDDMVVWKETSVQRVFSNDYPFVPIQFKPPYTDGMSYGFNTSYPFYQLRMVESFASEIRANIKITVSEKPLDLSVKPLSFYKTSTYLFCPIAPVENGQLIEVAPWPDADGTVRISYRWGIRRISLLNTGVTSKVSLIDEQDVLRWQKTVLAGTRLTEDYDTFFPLQTGGGSRTRMRVETAGGIIEPTIELVKLHA